MLVFIGLPLFYLELYIGQYTGVGPIEAFGAIAPFFSGLGYCTLVVITIVSIYYMIIVAWTLFYLIVSMTGRLNWGSCENDFNSICKYIFILFLILLTRKRCPEFECIFILYYTIIRHM